jgi:DNA-binding FadR family transcriptional regulator
MKLQAVSNRKLYIQIADQIRDLIESGAAEPGRQLPSERDLAQDLGVSRPTVREALIALEVAGLIDIRVGVGAFVRGRNGGVEPLPEQNHSPIEVMQARCIIEPEVAALAARIWRARSISPTTRSSTSRPAHNVQTGRGHFHFFDARTFVARTRERMVALTVEDNDGHTTADAGPPSSTTVWACRLNEQGGTGRALRRSS